MKTCKKCNKNETKTKKSMYCKICYIKTKNLTSLKTRKNRAIKRKQFLINKFGTNCNHCNKAYNMSVMCFHHLKPDEKLFTIDRDTLCKLPMDKILNESEKCIMLCQNCHLILHEKQNIIYNKNNQKKETIKLKNKYLERKRQLKLIFNNKCNLCSYESDFLSCFHFHHLDKSKKNFHLHSTKLAGKSWNSILEEANKCIMLCANCHINLEFPK